MRIYITILIMLFGAFVMIEIYRPKPLDWTRTFANKDKIPFGTELVYRLLSEQSKNQSINSVRIPVYNQLTDGKLPALSTYILVNNYCEIDKNDTEQLINYASKGNTVFIAANGFPKKLMDTLHFKLTQIDLIDYAKSKKAEDSLAKKQK